MVESLELIADIGIAVGTMLIICMILSYLIHKYHISFIPESVAQIFVGFVFGLCSIWILGPENSEDLKFSPEIFFFALLPPIILEAGYTMERKNFFRNLSTILMFAVLGTIVSTVIVGIIIYMSSVDKIISIDLTLLECLSYGALISAVDPVATLAILGSSSINADPMLYSIVFGESVLNDAVSIVLFQTLNYYSKQHNDDPSSRITVKNILDASGQFFLISGGSTLLGIGVGLLCSFIFKRIHLDKHPPMEILTVFIMSYISYCISDALALSGVMTLFFCGIVLRHYNWYNISKKAQKASQYGFKAMALGAEMMVFLYLGVVTACSLYPSHFPYKYDFLLSVIVIGACILARGFHILFFSNLANLGRKRRIPCSMQLMMWFAGLRGAIAFALALNIESKHQPVLVTATLTTVLFTTIICGGLTEKAMKTLGLSRSNADSSNGESTNMLGESFVSFGDYGMDFSIDDVDGQPWRYGGCHGCFNRFDRDLMKPIFGGKLEDRNYRVGDLALPRRG